MKKLLFILLSILTISCGVEHSNKQKEEVKEDSTTKVEINKTVPKNSFPENEKMIALEATGSYLNYFDHQRLGHPVFKSRYVDSVVKLRMPKFENADEALSYTMDYISISEMKTLEPEALIYYCMKYPASYAQICVIYMDTLRFNNSKIFSRIPFRSSDYQLSPNQVEILEKRRTEVILAFKNYFNSEQIDSYRDYFDILKLINAWEIFPEIIKTASEKNLINYTYLLEIMEHSNFDEFIKSKIRNGIYGEDSYYYGGGLESTEKNRMEIIRLAERFYTKMNLTKK